MRRESNHNICQCEIIAVYIARLVGLQGALKIVQIVLHIDAQVLLVLW